MAEAAVVGEYLGLEGIWASAAAFAVNYAISVQVNRAFGEKPPSQTDQGTRQQVPPSTSNALPVVYGSAYLGGTFVDAVLSTDQKCMYYVLAISSISPNGDFTYDTTDMYFGDRKITFDTTDHAKVVSLTDAAGNVDTTVNGYLWIGLYTSSATGVITPVNWYAPSTVMGATPPGGYDLPAGQQWPATGRQMNGTAFAIVKLIYSREANTTSMQPVTFHVKHTAAGVDRARPGDVWVDYMTNPQYGGAIDSAYLDIASKDALNAYADELITFTDYNGNPATQRRYTINGVINAGQTVLSNIDQILTACDSWMAYNAATGKWSIVINKAESTAYAFDDNNIIGEVRVSATDITSSVNQVEGKFPNKQNKDQPAYINISTPSNLLYPNEPVNKYTATFDLVNESVQAHYLANRILEQAREDLIVSFATTYYGIQVDAGNVVSVTNAGYGWTNKLFRVVRVNEISLGDGSLGARLDMTEYNAAVYDNQDITQYSPVPNSNLSSPSYFSSLTFPVVTGYPTASVPNFSVAVTVPATGRATTINLYYTSAAVPTPSDWKLLSAAYSSNSTPFTPSSTYTFTNQVLSAATYLFAYTVSNDVSQSGLSGPSNSFVWAPVAPVGPTGPTGGAGINSAVVSLYNKNTSTTAPALFSGTFTYTFATGVLSGGTLNGWAQTPPSVAAGEFLFVAMATASSTGATDTIPTAEFSTPQVISGTGTDGAKTAIVSLYQKNTSGTVAPTLPTGTFTYTFATAVLSGGTLNGWTQSIPTLTVGQYCWEIQATAYANAATDSIAANEFSAAVVVGAFGPTGPTGVAGPTGAAGGAGATGPRSASGYIYYGISLGSAPSQPSASGFDFTNGTFSSLSSGWSTVFNAPDPSTNPSTQNGSKYWAVRYAVSEATYGGTQTVTLTAPFNWQNMNGLVTFTNVSSNSGTTFIDGGNIVTGTIVANKLTSGTASITGGYTFLLASNGETINGFPAAVGGSNSNSSGMGVSGWITNTSSSGWGATTGATRSIDGVGIAGYNSANTSFTSFRTFGAFAQGAWGLSSIYHRSWGTVGNQTLPPVTYAIGGSADNGLYAAYWGNSSSARINEVFLGNATTQNAVVARRWIPDGGAIRTEANLATYDYCLYSTAGASYVAAGYLPFTGVHDGLVQDQDVYEVGDIVVDDQVLAKLDVSNVVVSYKRSSVAMEKGVIGVFVQSYVTPPADWNKNVPLPIAGGSDGTNLYVPVGGDPAIPNPVEYPVPAGMKVAHMNALGEGLVNVCGEGGDIAKGDFLTTSSMAGKGMKQSDDVFHSYTFGKAREAVTFSSPTEVKQIACIYMAG